MSYTGRPRVHAKPIIFLHLCRRQDIYIYAISAMTDSSLCDVGVVSPSQHSILYIGTGKKEHVGYVRL
jgi:hypothetical protein